jgi:hypothetical protein
MATIEKEVPNKKDERKINRDERRAKREERRDTAAGDIVSREAGRYGVDLSDLQKAPIGDAGKAKITEGVAQATNAEKWDATNKIAGFKKAYSGPSLEDRPELDEKALKESARKQRRSAWVDALTAFGQGVRTGRVDPESLRSTKFKREREAEFQSYRDITERNKKTKELWEHQYRTDLLDFVNKQIADEKVAASDRIKYQQMADELKAKNAKFEKEFGLKEREQKRKDAELKAKKEAGYFKKYPPRAWVGDGYSTRDSKTPYTDLYYELSGSSPSVINELAKITGGYAVDEDGNLKHTLRPAEAERLSNTLLKRMFTENKKTGELTPIPGMENYIDDLARSIEDSKAKEAEISSLQSEQYEKAKDANPWKKKYINEQYASKINQAQSELEQMQANTRNLMEGNIPPKKEEEDIITASRNLVDKYNEANNASVQIDKNGMIEIDGTTYDMNTAEGRAEFEALLPNNTQEKLDEFFK